jgi:D-xylose transport system permease protein
MSSTGASEAVPPVGEVEVTPPRVDFLRRFLQGDLGELRVILVLALIWAVFQVQEDRFLTSTNLTNLMLQMTGVALISVGVVMILLLGEIDLSVGAVSGLCAAVMAVLSVKHGWSPYTAIAAAIAVGATLGLLHGVIFTRFGVPSFVVTLAGLLAYQGAQLKVLGDTGTVNITDDKIVGLTGTFYGDSFGWALAVVGIASYAGISLLGRQRRLRAGLPAPPIGSLVIRIVLVGVAAIAAVAVLNADRGVPLALLILLGVILFFQFLTTRTRFGRHLYAVGGNAEAARRSGIHVDRVRIVVFMIGSAMATVGGIMLASRLLAVNQSSGSGDLLLLAIAGPVIAGTSLFGGRGTIWTALLGGLVIQSISNGMDLLALESSWKFMVTGGVLLIAVIIDSLARRQRQAAGRV